VTYFFTLGNRALWVMVIMFLQKNITRTYNGSAIDAPLRLASGITATSHAPPTPNRKYVTMKLDIEKYLVHMQGMDLTDKEKRELIIILCRFVDNCLHRTFGTDTAQLVLKERQLLDDKDKKVIVNSTNPKMKG
jgi:hypothetical protein